jgi:hypothetical protein
MRHVLVDLARRRPGDDGRGSASSMSTRRLVSIGRSQDFIAIDDALAALAQRCAES